MFYLCDDKSDIWLAFHYTLNELGLKCEFFNKKTMKYNDNDVFISQWKKFIPKMPKKYIIYVHNALNNDFILNIYKNLNKKNKILTNASLIFTFEKRDIPILKKYIDENKICFVPFGYTPFYENVFNRNNVNKDIDLLFYGSYRERRKIMIDKLRNRSYKVIWCGENKKNPSVYGKEKDNFINRSKIVLAINQLENGQIGNTLSRTMYLHANKIFCISEDSDIKDEFVDQLKINSIFFKTEQELYNLCDYYLKNDNEREKICQKMYDYVITNLKLDDFIPIDKLKDLSI